MIDIEKHKAEYRRQLKMRAARAEDDKAQAYFDECMEKQCKDKDAMNEYFNRFVVASVNYDDAEAKAEAANHARVKADEKVKSLRYDTYHGDKDV